MCWVLSLQYSWKLLHPTNEYDNKDCPKDAEAYERVSHEGVSSSPGPQVALGLRGPHGALGLMVSWWYPGPRGALGLVVP